MGVSVLYGSGVELISYNELGCSVEDSITTKEDGWEVDSEVELGENMNLRGISTN